MGSLISCARPLTPTPQTPACLLICASLNYRHITLSVKFPQEIRAQLHLVFLTSRLVDNTMHRPVYSSYPLTSCPLSIGTSRFRQSFRRRSWPRMYLETRTHISENRREAYAEATHLLQTLYGTYKTVKTRFWTWLSGKSPFSVVVPSSLSLTFQCTWGSGTSRSRQSSRRRSWPKTSASCLTANSTSLWYASGSSNSYHREVRGSIPGGGGFFLARVLPPFCLRVSRTSASCSTANSTSLWYVRGLSVLSVLFICFICFIDLFYLFYLFICSSVFICSQNQRVEGVKNQHILLNRELDQPVVTPPDRFSLEVVGNRSHLIRMFRTQTIEWPTYRELARI